MTFKRGVTIFVLIITMIFMSSCEKRISCDSAVSELLSERLQSENLEYVKVSYSWTEGYGSGDVYVTLRSDSISTVRVEDDEGEVKTMEASLPKERFNSLVNKIATSGFLCLENTPRKNCVADMGIYNVRTQIDSLSKEIYIDGETAVHDMDIFIDVMESIHGFGEAFEVSFFDWGPYGTSTIPCQ